MKQKITRFLSFCMILCVLLNLPLQGLARAASTASDILSSGGFWKLSMDSDGWFRIFITQAFNATEEMSMLFVSGGGDTSYWEFNLKNQNGMPLGSWMGGTGAFSGTITSSYSGVPSESTPIYQTWSYTINGVPLEITQFFKPVNHEKMLVVGLSIKNNSGDDVYTDIRAFIDTMMDIYGSVGYSDDRVPIMFTPKQNCFIAVAPTGRQGENSYGIPIGSPMPAPGAQYVIYYRDTPNISNADFWWVGDWNLATAFDYGYQSGVLAFPPASAGEPSSSLEWNQVKANHIPTQNYPITATNFDTSCSIWYDNRLIKAGEEMTVSFSISMSRANKPPVLETLNPNKPVFINQINNPATTMALDGTWYDNDSDFVDLYGVVDGLTPVMHGGGSINNVPGVFSGPQLGGANGAPSSRPFSANYDLSKYSYGWHVVDYYLEDPALLVSNQKSVRFVIYELDILARGFETIDQQNAYMHGNVQAAVLPSDAEIIEAGFVYNQFLGDLSNVPTVDNASRVVSKDWDGINKPFKAIAENLNPIKDYRYRTYVRIKWFDPIAGTYIYSYEYSEPKYLTTFQIPGATGSSTGDTGVNFLASNSSTGDDIATLGGGSGGNNAVGGGESVLGGIFGTAYPIYTPSVTPTAKSAKLVDETVDSATDEVPVTGSEVGRAAGTAIVLGLILSAVVLKKKRV